MKIFLSIICLVFLTNSFGQTTSKVEQNILKINLINPGFDYEFAESDEGSINLGLSLQPFWRNNRFGMFPNINLQYREYINLNRRMAKNKRTANNSGNYLALSSTIVFEKVVLGNLRSGKDIFGFVGPVYGLQRTSLLGLSWNMEFGLGYYFEGTRYGFLNSGNFAPIISMGLGWVLEKK